MPPHRRKSDITHARHSRNENSISHHETEDDDDDNTEHSGTCVVLFPQMNFFFIVCLMSSLRPSPNVKTILKTLFYSMAFFEKKVPIIT